MKVKKKIKCLGCGKIIADSYQEDPGRYIPEIANRKTPKLGIQCHHKPCKHINYFS